MKKPILIIAAMLLTVISYSQKKELREASKHIKNGSYVEAKNTLATLESSIDAADENIKAEYYLYKGQAYMGSSGSRESDLATAAKSFKKVIDIESSGKSKYSDEAKSEIQKLLIQLVKLAIEDQNAERYEAASNKLYTSYTLSKVDTSYLYYAAGNALNARNYDKAMKYYEELLDLGFTGIAREFVVIEKESGKEEVFGSKEEVDLVMLSGNYIKPQVRMSESKRPIVLRDLTAIYVDKGEVEKAKKLIADAKKETPNDMSIVRAEANLALQLNDMKTYNALMQKVVDSDPDNPELFYNLGVSSASIGESEKAEEYYKKALQLDPGYHNAKVNLAVLILEREEAIIEEMNSLGMSAKDNKRYDELMKEREVMYNEAIPYLESALKAKPDDIDIARTLMNIYSIMGNDAKFNQMKSKIEAMENN